MALSSRMWGRRMGYGIMVMLVLVVAAVVSQLLTSRPHLGEGRLVDCRMAITDTFYICAADQRLTAYISDALWYFKVPATNPGPIGLRILPLETFPIKKSVMVCEDAFPPDEPPCWETFADLVPGDLRAGALITVTWNGPAQVWQLGVALPRNQ